ncbi:MAG TPA: 3-oxoadipate enol-lactonase [Candidatus Eremiobacteraceae bacterium]|nr:3-oxoadipate enol-lactonase [Candidatus Eremiobacteraceae bacterium]
MPFAHLPDVMIHYEFDGDAHSPVLLLSNCLGTNMRMWDPQMDVFAEHFRVLRYDTRGLGRSGVTPGPYTIERLSRDALGLLDALQLDQVHFCGLSMGGMIGMFLGTNAATRCKKIVLCNTAAKIGTAESWEARIQAVQNGGMKAVANSVIERWLRPQFRSSHPGETQWVLAMLESANPQGYVANCAAVRDTDHRNTVKDIHAPCLVVSGTHDPATTPADGQALAKAIPGAQYVELPASHLSNIEARDDFNRQIVQFLLS